MTENEHQDLLVYLETLVGIFMKKTKGYNDFMKYPYLKNCDNTLAELLANDAIKAGL